MSTQYKPDPSGSLVERISIMPIATGPLDGLSFTVKDNIAFSGIGHLPEISAPILIVGFLVR